MDEKSERQMAVLSDLIGRYREGQFPLNALVQRMEGASNFIESLWWKDKLFPILLTLEQINAAALDSGGNISETDKASVASALHDLDALIALARAS
jgi:hypothetical protein